MREQVFVPLLYGCSICMTFFLYSPKQPLNAYLAPLPFWLLFARPIGLFWRNSVLKKINEGVFPPEMKMYSEMYLSSRRALVYDLLLNHLFINNVMSGILLSYVFVARTINDRFIEEKAHSPSFASLIQATTLPLVRGRAAFSLFGVLTQYTLTYVSRVRNKEAKQLNPSLIKFLLIKEFILYILWGGYSLKIINESYSKFSLKQIESN